MVSALETCHLQISRNEADGGSSVTSYSTESGVLTLQYRGSEDRQLTFASVDVNLVLQSLKAEQTRVGEWVNVIGYVTSTDSKKLGDTNPVVEVQATLLWSAGPLNLEKYEASVQALDGEERS